MFVKKYESVNVQAYEPKCFNKFLLQRLSGLNLDLHKWKTQNIWLKKVSNKTETKTSSFGQFGSLRWCNRWFSLFFPGGIFSLCLFFSWTLVWCDYKFWTFFSFHWICRADLSYLLSKCWMRYLTCRWKCTIFRPWKFGSPSSDDYPPE